MCVRVCVYVRVCICILCLIYIYTFFLIYSIYHRCILSSPDPADPGVGGGHHRVPPGRVLRLLHQAAGPGPEGAGALQGVRHAPDGHLRHRLHHQLRGHHDPQHPLRTRGHLDHRLW